MRCLKRVSLITHISELQHTSFCQHISTYDRRIQEQIEGDYLLLKFSQTQYGPYVKLSYS